MRLCAHCQSHTYFFEFDGERTCVVCGFVEYLDIEKQIAERTALALEAAQEPKQRPGRPRFARRGGY